MSLNVDREQTERYLTCLFGEAFGSDHRIYTWGLDQRINRSYSLADPGSIDSLIADLPSADTFVGMSLTEAPIPPRQRCKIADSVGLTAVWLDIDIQDPTAHKGKSYPPTFEAAVELLSSGPPPTMVVTSGYGLHAYWVLQKPLMFSSDRDREEGAALAKGWVQRFKMIASEKGFEVDSVGDLARIMRLPGTFNCKDPANPRPVKVASDNGPRHSVTELRDLIDSESTSARTGGSATKHRTIEVGDGVKLDPDATPPKDKFEDLLKRQRVRDAFYGQRTDLPSRSEVDLSLAVSAVRAGWSDQEILDLLVFGRNVSHGKPKRLGYFVQTVGKARESSGVSASPEPDSENDEFANKLASFGVAPVLAEILSETEHFAIDAAHRLYRLEGGRYVASDEFIRTFARSTLEDFYATKFWRSHLGSHITDYLWPGSPRLWSRPSLNELNVANGIIDLGSMALGDHRPDHLSTIQLPVVFDPDATCPGWDDFIASTFPADATQLAWEIIAAAMVPDPSLQKAVLLLGSGGEGKSTFLAGVTAFLGAENVSSETLQRLESNRFAASRLLGKLANISADLPSAQLEGSAVLKGLTGGDLLTMERKNENAFDGRPHALPIFSANSAPRTPDPSPAFFDRWLVIRLSRSHRRSDHEIPRSVLDARLADPAELSGVLNRALAALPQLRLRGFDEPESVVAAKAEFRKVTDPMAVWLDEHLLESTGSFVPKETLHRAFCDWATTEGYRSPTMNRFGRDLKAARPQLIDGQRKVGGRRRGVWVDVSLTPHEWPDSECLEELANIITDGAIAVSRNGAHRTVRH